MPTHFNLDSGGTRENTIWMNDFDVFWNVYCMCWTDGDRGFFKATIFIGLVRKYIYFGFFYFFPTQSLSDYI
jgi:hypothetical protein